MKAKLMMQSENENKIIDNLIKASEAKPKKAYFFIGNFKESGFEMLENCLIDLKARKLFVIGVDKKNTTKKMLEQLYKYTKNIFIYNNNELVELDSNIIIFEYLKKAVIYVLSGNCSKGGLEENLAIYTVLEYNLEDKKDKTDYEEYVSGLVNITKSDVVKKLDKEFISELMDSKVIFSNKQYNHKLMSIAELAAQAKIKQKTENLKMIKTEKNSSNTINIDENLYESKDNIYEEDAKLNIGEKLDLADVSFEIDFGDIKETIAIRDEKLEKKELKEKEIKVKKMAKEKTQEKEIISSKYNDEEVKFDPESTLDLENILFDKSSAILDTRKIEKKVKEEKLKKKQKKESTQNKKIDLNKVSNIVMESPKKPSKGKDKSAIKIPNYIKEMIPNFFEAMEDSIAVDKKDGLYKEVKIALEIVDVVEKKKHMDKLATISSKVGQTYISFISEMMSNVDYEEGDIIRLIKLSKNIYHIEIISKNSQEYKIWRKMCTQKFRGVDRQYGLM